MAAGCGSEARPMSKVPSKAGELRASASPIVADPLLELPGSPSSTTTLVLSSSPGSMTTLVLPAIPSSTAAVPAAVRPASPPSPTSKLTEEPEIMPSGSPDLSAPTKSKIDLSWMEPNNILPDPSMYVRRPDMTWEPALSQFILDRIVELVNGGVSFTHGFREGHMRKITNDVLDFTGTTVTTLQLYNHLRKWRSRWNRIVELRSVLGLRWCPASTSFTFYDEDKMFHYIFNHPKDVDLLNKPIINFAQMRTIFPTQPIDKRHLFDPKLLIQAIDYLADNKEEMKAYA